MEPTHSGTDGTQPASSGGGWLFPVFLAIVLVVLVALVRPSPDSLSTRQSVPEGGWATYPDPTSETVRLTIDFGDGTQKEFDPLPWHEGMTVAGLLETARNYRPGVEFTQQGAGESGFLTSLDGRANEGASGRNWLYRVGARHAHVSFCLEKVEPGMHVLWTFTDEQYNDEAAEK